ncbi:DUF5361 domain-containing protein [Mycobacteroides abscessus]|uniref:DUF5361 domain-containing protein n=1 Tax=Mycobacteroides abscessus TaxID=36809 RepID=UPI0009417448
MHAFTVASPPGTAIHYELAEQWPLDSHLLAGILERLNDWLWLHTKDAQRKPPQNRPKQIPRPGVRERLNALTTALGGRKQQVVPLGAFASLWRDARARWKQQKGGVTDEQ